MLNHMLSVLPESDHRRRNGPGYITVSSDLDADFKGFKFKSDCAMFCAYN